MKTFRIIGMALIAVLVTVNLISCSKEELPQYELVTTGKKIKKITINDSFIGYAEYNFKYDDTGKLIEITYNDGDDVHKFDYVWSSDAVNSYTLKDGLIRSDGYSNVIYGGLGKPIEINPQSSYCYYHKLVWDSGNDGLSRKDIYYHEVNRSKLQSSLRFIYDENSITCNNYNPIVPILLSEGFNGDLLSVAHPELVNARTTKLPSKFILEDFWLNDEGRLDSDPIRGNCNYSLDIDGYVVSYSMFGYSSMTIYTASYSIIWE